MALPLTENDVVDAVCVFVEAAGWRVQQRLTTNERGIDIVAESPRQGRRLRVEAKGGTSSKRESARYGKPFTRSQAFDRVAQALYTAVEIRDGSAGRRDRTAIALPAIRLFRDYVGRIHDTLQMLDIGIFWVEETLLVRLDAPWDL